jgi:hypothetical protein
MMNYKIQPSDIPSLIADIEYLRKVGRYPWQGASARRAMEKRFSYNLDLDVKGHKVEAAVSTGVSCNYVRFGVVVLIDGERQARYIPALRKLA